jgi:hypothetical protein
MTFADAVVAQAAVSEGGDAGAVPSLAESLGEVAKAEQNITGVRVPEQGSLPGAKHEAWDKDPSRAAAERRLQELESSIRAVESRVITSKKRRANFLEMTKQRKEEHPAYAILAAGRPAASHPAVQRVVQPRL